MKKLHVLYAVLLVGVVLALVLLTGPRGRKPKAEDREAGRTPRSVQPGSGKTSLRGTVRHKDAGPLKGATVFVLPKKQPGGVRDRLPHEVSGEDGRWTLRARAVEESWIGAVAAGYRHAWLDGAALEPGSPIVHELERAPALRVTLLDLDGRPIRKKGVQLEPWPPRTTYFLPGPRARQGEQWKVTDSSGVATFRVGDAGPVTIRPHVEGHHCTNDATWLEKTEGDVTLHLRPSLSLHLKLLAAESLLGVSTLVTVDLHDATTGTLALSHTDAPGEGGLLEINRAIRPGVYDVHIHGEGRASAVLPGLVFDGATEPGLASARLGVAPEPARLRLDLGAGTASAGGRRRRAPLVFLFRPAEMWRSHGWERGAPESWNPDEARLVLRLPPDRYHVLVADVTSRRAALLQNVVLAAGAEVDVKAAMRRGLRTSVNALIAANGRTRTVEVAGVGVGKLPVYGITSDGRVRVSRAVDVLARVEEGAGVYLGPYPFEGITILVTGWDGGVVTHDVER